MTAIFDKMITATQSILQQIHHHSFNIELANGTLPKNKFIFYLIQDSLYLADYARALALTAARLIDNRHVQQFLKFSLSAIEAETSLHTNYLNKHSVVDLNQVEQTPACFMYTSYLFKMASTASVEEAVASLLPCFWVYREVGKKIVKSNSFDHPYREWISLYSSESYDAEVQSAINTMNELGANATERLKSRMISAFIRATELEWVFWEGAYLQEQRFVMTKL